MLPNPQRKDYLNQSTSQNKAFISSLKFMSVNISPDDSKIQPPYFSSQTSFRFLNTHLKNDPTEEIIPKVLNEISIPTISSEMDMDKIWSPKFNVSSPDEINKSQESKERRKTIGEKKSEEKENFSPHDKELMSTFSFGPNRKSVSYHSNSHEVTNFQEMIRSKGHILPLSEICETDSINLNQGIQIKKKLVKKEKTKKKASPKPLKIGKHESNETFQLQDSFNTTSNQLQETFTTIGKISTSEEINKKPTACKTKIKILQTMKKLNDLDDLTRIYLNHLKVLKSGKIMLKYGRRNLFGPAKRKIQFNGEMNSFSWDHLRKTFCNFEVDQKEKRKKFDLKDIKEVLDGRQTSNFKRFKTNDEEKIKLSFSIVLNERTVDLEALTLKDKEEFVTSLIKILLLRKKMMLGNILGIKI